MPLEKFDNFPLTKVVKGLISYTQFVFGSLDHVPSVKYLWNKEDRETKIRIQTPFAIDDERPMSQPFIVFKRGPFRFQNSMIDNLKASDANVFTNPEYVDIMDGTLHIICGSRSPVEAEGMAQFMAVLLQSNRHEIIKSENMEMLRNMNYLSISEQLPVFKDTQVTRWEITLSMDLSLQIGWFKRCADDPIVIWNKVDIKAIDEESRVDSDKGETTLSSDLLVDNTKNFGILNTNDPQLVEQQLNRGWYYIQFKEDTFKRLYKVVEIVDSVTLRLEDHDVNEDPIPFSAPTTDIDLEYTLFWNDVNLDIHIPNNS